MNRASGHPTFSQVPRLVQRFLNLVLLAFLFTNISFAQNGETKSHGGSQFVGLNQSYLQEVFAGLDDKMLISSFDRHLADTLFLAADATYKLIKSEYTLISRIDRSESLVGSDRQAEHSAIALQLQGLGYLNESGERIPFELQRKVGSALEQQILYLLESLKYNPYDDQLVEHLVAAYSRLSRVFRSAEVLNQCLALYDFALSQNAQSHVAHFELALVLRDLDRKPEALVHLYAAEELLIKNNSHPSSFGFGFQGIPLADDAVTDPDKSQLRDEYVNVLQQQFLLEQELHLRSNAMFTLVRLQPFNRLEANILESNMAALRWGGSAEAQDLFQKGVDAENSEDYPLAVELYTKALRGIKDPSILSEVYYSLGDLNYYRLANREKGLEFFRKMRAAIPTVAMGARGPADDGVRAKLNLYGSAHQHYADELSEKGLAEQAVKMYEHVLAAPSQARSLTLVLHSDMIHLRYPSVAISQLEKLESMFAQNSWELPEDAADRKALKVKMYKTFIDIYSRVGEWNKLDHYRQLLTAEAS